MLRLDAAIFIVVKSYIHKYVLGFYMCKVTKNLRNWGFLINFV